MATKTAWQLLQETPLRTLSFGCPIIDSSIGRFPCRGICEISGEAGSGKTQFGLSISLEAVFNENYSELTGGAAYVTCGEGLFPIKRLSQLAQKYENMEKGVYIKDILSRVHIEECMNFEDVVETLSRRIPDMCRNNNIKLLVIDSLAGMIRHEYDAMKATDMRDRTNFIFSFAKQLKWLSDVFQIGILVINQVTASGFLRSDQSSQSFFHTNPSSVPALGLTWSTCVTHRYIVSKSTVSVNLQEEHDNDCAPVRYNRRMIELVFSPLYPNNACYYIVDNSGLHGH